MAIQARVTASRNAGADWWFTLSTGVDSNCRVGAHLRILTVKKVHEIVECRFHPGQHLKIKANPEDVEGAEERRSPVQLARSLLVAHFRIRHLPAIALEPLADYLLRGPPDTSVTQSESVRHAGEQSI
jgi:hypothetical protein